MSFELQLRGTCFTLAGPETIPQVNEASVMDLVKQRSMLVILIAACTTARTEFEGSGTTVDQRLLADLSTMIARSEAELGKLAQRLEAALN